MSEKHRNFLTIILVDKEKVFYLFDGENDENIYDGLVVDAPEDLFNYGEHFKKISFKGLDLDEYIVTRQNFYLFKKQLLCIEKGKE